MMPPLEDLQRELATNNATWQAGKTTLTDLPLEQLQKRLGVERPPEAALHMELQLAIAPSVAAPPPNYDWRSHGGVTAIRDQGDCGSCVSFACCAATESQCLISRGQLLDLSEADSHFCSSHGATCCGWWPSNCLSDLANRGVVIESDFAYASAQMGGFDPNCGNTWTVTCRAVSNRSAKTTVITGQATFTDPTAMKQRIATVGPLVTCFDVYNDFYSYAGGVYTRSASATYVGGHCVEVVGYDDNAQPGCWICKNSWGTGWGEQGFFRIAYGQCGIDNQMWAVQGIAKLPNPVGIGGYDLADGRDRVFAVDYDGSGVLDHMALYRPGTGTMWILKNTAGNFAPVYQRGDPGDGIGGYDLKSNSDRAFPFDYDGSGKLDHMALYRPGTGTMWILRNAGGTFAPVYQQGDPGNGIGGYDLRDLRDQAFAFDYDGSGRLDHMVLYRPGTGTMWILSNNAGNFAPVYQQGAPGNGIGGYDLRDNRDRAFAFDYDSSGKLDHMALYRPGTGTMWILRNTAGVFTPVYQQGAPGNGIGGYDLRDNRDFAFAFDYDGSGKLDHMALCRPGTGTIWILSNNGGVFTPVYRQGAPGNGIGGYDLMDNRDRAIAFDYEGSGKLNYLVMYRPGTGTIWIIKNTAGVFSAAYVS
jgi:hypothetical protein